jgi:hypothetical protein
MPDSNPRPHTDPMQAAIQATLTAIQNRARLYRNLVIGVSLVVLACAILALVFHSAIPLLGVSLLVPVVGAYFVLDSRQTRQWSSRILQRWSEGKLNLAAFSVAMTAHPYAPRGTLEGMLSLLRVAGEERLGSNQERKALLEWLELQALRHERRTALATVGLLSMLVCLGASIRLQSGILLGCSIGSLLLWFGSWRA